MKPLVQKTRFELATFSLAMRRSTNWELLLQLTLLFSKDFKGQTLSCAGNGDRTRSNSGLEDQCTTIYASPAFLSAILIFEYSVTPVISFPQKGGI
jgi:hypothetical protein